MTRSFLTRALLLAGLLLLPEAVSACPGCAASTADDNLRGYALATLVLGATPLLLLSLAFLALRRLLRQAETGATPGS